jgi:NAD(P)-dependent dehydrogenase (short-subunit alcohol dehydrogenase family)
MLKKINLKNKTALVTGAGKGLGKACAIALAEAGAKVIILSRTKSDLDKVNRIIKKTKGSSKSFVCDVTQLEEFKKILQKITRLTNLNMKAAFNVAQLCSQKMVKAKNRKKIGGSIIHMSSQLGRVGCEGRNVYNMNKFGVEGLARGMAVELAEYNIRVNTVCPTFVETPMVKKFFKNKKFKNQMLRNIPLGRVAKESDVATAVAFLAADSSEMITGTSLVVDGGWTAQ